ncbi:MAG: DUF2249 domain-containing protein [Bacteroidota bacterium]|nr:DUF2249 domain-containing protein [Bacteroidota bacterium]MDP4229885.1 DUF2249 domain-containing protein [Bacteroidota bacterium]MDP4237218.1 DUF2249 domain-containing protein [Bacteroidota bacterium]
MTETIYSTELDIRPIPPPEKHPTIFRVFDGLEIGESFLLINDHNPKPLYYQFGFERMGKFEWEDIESGPVVWRVGIKRIA